MGRALALLTLSLSLGALPAGASPFDPTLMREDTPVAFVGPDLGTTGLAVVDLDGVGREEVVVGGRRGWAVLAFGPGGRLDLVRRYRSFNTEDCMALRVGDVEGDGTPDVVGLFRSPYPPLAVDIVVFDIRSGEEKARQRVLDWYGYSGLDLLVSNVEGGPEAELFVLSRDEVWMGRLGEPPLWIYPAGGRSLALGNVDDDLEPELVVATGRDVTGMVLEPTRRRPEWIYTPGFGSYLALVDADSDGRAEIFGVSGGKLACVDGRTRVPRWRSASSVSSETPPVVLDFEGDGRLEIVAVGQTVLRFDPLTGESSSLENAPGYSPLVAPIDLGGCQSGLIWSNEDAISAWSPLSASVSLTPEALRPYVSPWFAVGPLRGDGRTKVVWSAESDSNLADILGVSDLQHDVVEERHGGRADYTFDYGGPIALAQLDDDPALEYATPEEIGYPGEYRVSVFDGLDHTVQWSTEPLYAETPKLVSGDLDEDGADELIVATRSGSSGFVRLYEATTGSLRWKSDDLMGQTLDMAIGDVDGLPGRELLVAAEAHGVYAFQAGSRLPRWLLPEPKASAVAVGHVSGDATPDLVVGRTDGSFAAFDGPTRSLLFEGTVGAELPISAVRVTDVDGDGAPELVIAHARSYVYGSAGPAVLVVRPSDQSVLWRSPALQGYSGAGGSLFVGDADDDGKTEILVGAGWGIFSFEYDAGAPDATTPIWEGLVGLTDAREVLGGCCPQVDLSWGRAFDAASPPVSYRVHRGPPEFVPSDATVVAETAAQAFQDRRLSPETPYEYLVRAVDRLGNEDDNEERILVSTAADVVVTIAPLGPSICPNDEVELVVSVSRGTPSRYQWYRNGQPTGANQPTLKTSEGGSYLCVVSLGTCPGRSSPASVVNVLHVAGDVTGECTLSIADAFALAGHLMEFASWMPLPVPDVDGSGDVDAGDLDYLLDHLVAGGPAPVN